MAINVTVKNTFLEVKLDMSRNYPECRRSSSVPRAFKPGCNATQLWDDDHSTSASEMFECCQTVLSDFDYQDCLLDSSDWSSDVGMKRVDSFEDFVAELYQPSEDDTNGNSKASEDDTNGNSKVKLSLVDMVSKSKLDGRSKLRSLAQPFQSVIELPEEVKALLYRSTEVLRRHKDVLDVQVRDGRMGGTMMIVAQCFSLNDTSVIPSVKEGLLAGAAESEKTYVMGYNVKPFNDLDAHSFSAKIGHVPDGHMSTACWDTYEKGFCPRCNKCRWSHPGETDTLRVIFILKLVV